MDARQGSAEKSGRSPRVGRRVWVSYLSTGAALASCCFGVMRGPQVRMVRFCIAMEDLPVWKRDLPATPHKLLNDLVTVLVTYYDEHLRRDAIEGRLRPREAWDLLRGFLLAAMQTYAAICILLAEKRPKRLMLQAGVLDRALFEILATVLGIVEDQAPRAKALLRESHKAQATRYQYLVSRWGSDPNWS